MTNHEHGAMPELLPCPFCGHKPPADLADTLYPSGTYWREEDGLRHYVGHRERMDGDNPCWTMHCKVSDWGCGAKITADSEEEVIAAWNRRAAIQQAAGAVPEGMQLVPIEPTPHMLLLASDVDGQSSKMSRQIWLAMLEAATPTPPASGGSSDHLVPCAGGGVKVPLLFSRRKGIADKLGMQMTPQFNAIVRAVELAHGIDWFVEPATVTRPGQIKELSSNGGREGV